MKTQSIWIRGLVVGLITLAGIVCAGLISIPFIPEGPEAIGIGMLLLCFYQFWIIAGPIIGMQLYRHSNNVISAKDGLLIGAISSIVLVIPILGLGILQETVFYNPDDLARGATISIALGMAGWVFIGGCIGGFLGASMLPKNKSGAQMTDNSIQNMDEHPPQNITQPVTITATSKSPIVAALLSLFLFGGAGQIYLGQWKKGLALIIASFLGLLLPLFFLIALSIGVSDAFNIASKMKKGNSVEEWEFNITFKTIGLATLASIGVLVIFISLFYLGFIYINYMPVSNAPAPTLTTLSPISPLPTATLISAPPTFTLVPLSLTQTPFPLSSVDLFAVFTEAGDIPNGLSSTLITGGIPPTDIIDDIPEYENIATHYFEDTQRSRNAFAFILLYQDEQEIQLAYNNLFDKLGADPNKLPDIGDEAASHEFLDFANLAFRRCHSVIYIRISRYIEKDDIEVYAKNLDAVLAKVVCP